jgi:hypothetical protein
LAKNFWAGKNRQIYKEGFVSFAKTWKNLNNGGRVWLKNFKKILKLVPHIK